MVFLRLGLTSFGGPVAHLGYFREEFVTRRHWLDDHSYADLVALCQFLPGPASSQVGIAIGLLRAGYAGALAAWIGFTLPSAIALVLFAYGLSAVGDSSGSGWLHGLKVAAVAVVAQVRLSAWWVTALQYSWSSISLGQVLMPNRLVARFSVPSCPVAQSSRRCCMCIGSFHYWRFEMTLDFSAT
jgi:putative chromate ion transporter